MTRRGVWIAGAGGVLAVLPAEGAVRRFGSEHGLPGNAVHAIGVDADDRPWAAAADGGLACLVDGRWQLCTQAPEEPLHALVGADGGGVWAASDEAVYRIEAHDQQAVTACAEALDVEALLDDGAAVLAGGPAGLFRLRPGHDAQRVAEDTLPECTALARAPGGPVFAAALGAAFRIDGDRAVPLPPLAGRIIAMSAGRGVLWALTPAGPARLRDDRWSTFGGAARVIASSGDGRQAWTGGERAVHVVDATTGTARAPFRARPSDELTAPVRCVLRDEDGVVLAGTGEGLARFAAEHDVALDRSFGDVRSLALAGGRAWALSWPGGLRRVDAPEWSRAPAGAFALATGADAPHVLAGHRLLRFNGDAWSGVAPPLPHAPRCATRVADGTWWVGTTAGTYSLDHGEWRLAGAAEGPLGAEVHALHEIGHDLWLATSRGLYQRTSEGWRRHIDGPVRALTPASRAGCVWVAVAGGVVRYDVTGASPGAVETPLTSGLPSRRVTAMLDAGGALWVTTAAGIGRRQLDPEET